MAAVIDVVRWTGQTGEPMKTIITNAANRMSASDNPIPGTDTPIPLPVSGTNYSYWVANRLNCTSAPLNGINNIRWFSDGLSFGTGFVCAGNQATGYRQATGTFGVTGTVLNVSTSPNHYNFGGTSTSPLVANPVDISTITQYAPVAIDGSLAGGATGDFGNFFVYQLAVSAGAVVGTVPSRTTQWTWDEV